MIEFKIDLDHLEKGIVLYDQRAIEAVGIFANTQAKNLERDAKKNRPWIDRTGEARKRLTGYVERIEHGYRIILAHGVDYGIWLELANEGKYGIVGKMIDIEAPFIMRDFEGLLDKLGYGGVIK